MIRFDEFTLDTLARTLHRGTEEVRLSPKLFDLLVLLIERHGTTVDKDEILRVVWPGVVVEESGLARNVSLLRKALGEEDGSRFIVTVPKRGYRFVAPLGAPAAPVPAPPPRGIRYAGIAVLAAAAGIAAFFALRHPALPPPEILPLTTHAAEQAVDAAAITADGSYLALYDLTGLYVRPLGSQEARRIELPAGLFPTQLEWFPDKAHLLMSAFDPSTGKSSAWVVPVLGGAPALLNPDASYATVSADGQRIAFISRSNQIWLANSDGSGARVFAALPATERIAGRLQFMADDTQLLNGRAIADHEEAIVESRRLSDGAVTQLLVLPHFPVDLLLLPRDELVVSRLANGEAIDTVLEQYHLDPAATRAQAVVLARYPAAWVYGLSATADGSRVTFVHDPAQADVYVADLEPSGAAISNVRRLTFDEARDRLTAWAPDSRHVVFHSNRGGRWNVYLQAIDEPSATLLTPGEGNHAWAAISPDQKWLLYMAGKNFNFGPDVDYNLMRKPLAGGPAEVLSPLRGTAFRRVHCARTGTRCVLMERVGEERVFYALDPEHGVGAELARTGWGPDWLLDWDLSPTGDRIAAIDSGTVRNRITVIALDGGAPQTTRVIVPGFQALLAINWDLDGKGFYVASTDTLAGGLLHVALDGTTTFLRRDADGDSWAIPSPDGKHLAILEWTIAGNVWEIRRSR
jgi:DNA-binding winged helix-turn-helix (wHTH) protein